MTAVRSVPAVTEELLSRVAADPDWTARVLCAAANVLNTLTKSPQPSGLVRDGAEELGIVEVLTHAFIDWEQMLEALGVSPQ